MNPIKTFRINLPTLFERVNERRREQGLAPVEPAVMAVRASIKFSIRQQKHLNLKGEEVEIAKEDADALRETLGELFNVDLSLAENNGTQAAAAPTAARAPAEAAAGEATWVLPLFQFYAAINRERRAKGLHPVEPAVISVRTGIKFSIMRRRTLNFREDKLLLSEADLHVLDSILPQQFDVAIPGGLVALCLLPAAGARPSAASPVPAGSRRQGFLARFLALLSGKRNAATHHTHHYTLDTSNLLLSILTRRAYLGHKPLTPDKVKDRCGKALSAVLELAVDMDDEKIALTPEQIDAFADIIRKEFEIMFEDLDDLLGKKPPK